MNLSTLPDWVEWLAQDAEPNQQRNGWYENEAGRIVRLEPEAPPADWKATLARRTR